MGWTITQFLDTPNPNAIKCVLDRPIVPAPRSFSSPAAASADPIASRLFALPGVTNLLVHPTWITVNKDHATSWKSLKPAISKVLADLHDPLA